MNEIIEFFNYLIGLDIDLSEFFKVGIPALISIVGFIITVQTTKKNITAEIEKQNSKNFLESFAKIEYDIAEILQLCVIEKLEIDKDNYFAIKKYFPYYIVETRGNEYRNNNCAERIYRLCGYVTTFCSGEARLLFCMLQQEYHKYDMEDMVGPEDENEKKDYLEKLIAIISLLLVQIKLDATNKYMSYKEWIDIRLPIYDGKYNIYNHCSQIIEENNLSEIKKLEESASKNNNEIIIDLNNCDFESNAD